MIELIALIEDASVTIPISVAFPALKGFRARSGRSRSLTDATDAAQSYDDPLFKNQLLKIDVFMEYIGVCLFSFL